MAKQYNHVKIHYRGSDSFEVGMVSICSHRRWHRFIGCAVKSSAGLLRRTNERCRSNLTIYYIQKRHRFFSEYSITWLFQRAPYMYVPCAKLSKTERNTYEKCRNDTRFHRGIFRINAFFLATRVLFSMLKTLIW